jgi:cytochrome c oxidase subunit 2
MRGVIVVETQAEYDAWLATKKPQYVTLQEQNTPAPAAADSTAASKPMAQMK